MSTIPEHADVDPARSLTETQQLVWGHWVTTSAQLPAAITRELQAAAGLSLPDFEALQHLNERPAGRARVTGLAQSLSWEKSRASRHLTRMEGRGLVAREECHDDGRGAYVGITHDGRTALDRATPGHVRMVQSLMFEDLTATEVTVLRSVLEKILARLPGQVPDAASSQQ